MSKNPAWYSHKFKQAAVEYEIRISIFTQQVVWISGPHKASRHDITIFREEEEEGKEDEEDQEEEEGNEAVVEVEDQHHGGLKTRMPAGKCVDSKLP
jgi:hypothetical protein